MSLKADAKEIEIFAFVPVGRGPNESHAADHRVLSWQAYLQSQSLAAVERKQVVIHFEAWLNRESIHGRDVGKERKPQRWFAGQKLSRVLQALTGNNHCCFATELEHFGDRLGVPLPQFMHHWILVSKP